MGIGLSFGMVTSSSWDFDPGVRETMEPLPGYGEATLPGTVEYRNQQAYAEEGVPYAIEDLERLEECGRQCGVEAEWSL